MMAVEETDEVEEVEEKAVEYSRRSTFIVEKATEVPKTGQKFERANLQAEIGMVEDDGERS